MQAFSDEDRARDTTRSYFQVPRQNASTSSPRDLRVDFDKGIEVWHILRRQHILALNWKHAK